MADSKVMNVNYYPSVEHHLIVGYAITIINNPDIKNLVGEFRVFDINNIGWTDAIDEGQWKFMRGMAMIVLSRIIDPSHKELQDRVIGTVRSLCVEIQKWMEDHQYIEIKGMDIEDIVHWSYEGLIDRENTAKELVINEDLSIQSRFELACNYCFMYQVESLWNSMSESEKGRYSGKHVQDGGIIHFWTKWVTTGARKDLLLLPDGYFDQLCFSAYYTNSVALKCLLEMLTIEDKLQYLTKIAKEKYLIPRVMRFCLLEMDCNQKADMFMKTPFKTLKCFLDFPWQNSFLDTALNMWLYLRDTDFVHLIYFIIYERIIPEWNDYNYGELLTEFWIQSPYPFKIYTSQQEIFDVLNFIVGQMLTHGSVSTTDLYNFLKGFTLSEEVEEKYQKACRSC